MAEKIGVYICECGPNIANLIDIDRIISELSETEEYKDKELVVKRHKLLCSPAGKKFLETEIIDNELTHLVCAACSPRDHDLTFREICKKTTLNPFMYKLVNIREQCAWITPDKEKATDKAIKYIRAGIERVLYQDPLFEKQLESQPDVLVVGGGITGIESALSLAGENRAVYLVEKSDRLGGKAGLFKELLPRQGGNSDHIREKIKRVEANPHIRVFLQSGLSKIVGFLGNYEVTIADDKTKEETELLAGGVILANGYEVSEAREFEGINYSDKDEVYNAIEIEKMYAEKGRITRRDGSEPAKVVLVHCIGRQEVGYCSKICCNYLYKIANYLLRQNKAMEVIDLHQDICLPEKEDEEFYDQIAGKGIEQIRVKKVFVDGNKIVYIDIDCEEKTLETDMVILATALLPGKDNPKLAEQLNLELHESGFFEETHIKVNPVATNTDGVFVAGGCRGPAGISDAIVQAEAASGRILTQLVIGQKITPEVMVSEILADYCTGCKTCLDVCVYGAISFNTERGISVVNEAICRGCGNCVGSCPSGAIRTRHFTGQQLSQEVKEALRKKVM